MAAHRCVLIFLLAVLRSMRVHCSIGWAFGETILNLSRLLSGSLEKNMRACRNTGRCFHCGEVGSHRIEKNERCLHLMFGSA